MKFMLILAVLLLCSASYADSEAPQTDTPQMQAIRHAMAGVAKAKSEYNASRARGDNPEAILRYRTHYHRAYANLQAELEQQITGQPPASLAAN